MKPPQVCCTTCTISAVGPTTLLLYIAVPLSARVVSTCKDRVPVQSNILLRSRITDLWGLCSSLWYESPLDRGRQGFVSTLYACKIHRPTALVNIVSQNDSNCNIEISRPSKQLQGIRANVNSCDDYHNMITLWSAFYSAWHSQVQLLSIKHSRDRSQAYLPGTEDTMIHKVVPPVWGPSIALRLGWPLRSPQMWVTRVRNFW